MPLQHTTPIATFEFGEYTIYSAKAVTAIKHRSISNNLKHLFKAIWH